jgi:hypothetical protein
MFSYRIGKSLSKRPICPVEAGWYQVLPYTERQCQSFLGFAILFFVFLWLALRKVPLERPYELIKWQGKTPLFFPPDGWSLKPTCQSHPEEGTAALDESYLETVIYHNREYQQYAITNQTYFAPTDEVRCLLEDHIPVNLKQRQG